jgi:tRNA pseudouridine55 synthase
VINLDKPAGPSSAAVLNRVKRVLPRGTKLGHAGTLDPFATGVLVTLVGKGTKLSEWFMHQPKQYVAILKLGATTETLDPESPEMPHPDPPPVTLEQLQERAAAFVGTIRQRPPVYSAMKIGGRRAYDLARKGHAVEPEPRDVRIDRLEIQSLENNLLTLTVDCGRGTYIRSLARDLAAAVGTWGYLTALRRTRVGPLTASSAVNPEVLATQGVAAHILPLTDFQTV